MPLQTDATPVVIGNAVTWEIPGHEYYGPLRFIIHAAARDANGAVVREWKHMIPPARLQELMQRVTAGATLYSEMKTALYEYMQSVPVEEGGFPQGVLE